MPADPKWYEPFVTSRMVLTDEKLAPYLAPIADRCTPVPVPNLGTDIACDIAYRIFYDPAYAMRIATPTFNADLGHEIAGHLLGEHHQREAEHGATDHALWGLATDAVLNDQTIAHLAAAHPKAIQPGGQIFRNAEDPQARRASRWIWPESYNLPPNGTAETYYDLLAQQKAQAQQQAQQGQQGSGQGQQGQQGRQTPGNGPQTPQGASGKPGTGPGPSGGSNAPQSSPQGSGKGSGHGAPQPIGAGQGQGQGQGGAGPTPPPNSRIGSGSCGSCAGAGGDARMAEIHAKAIAVHGSLPGGVPEEERESLRQEVAQAVVAHAAAKGRGSVPAGLLRVCEELIKPPKIKWQKRIATLVRTGIMGASRGSADWSMIRPRWKTGIGFPRLTTPKVRVAVVADTSGSMGATDLARILSEVKGLLQSNAVERLWWVPTDANADKVIRATDMSHARNALIGGGGTNMGAGLDTVAKKCRPKPHLTLVITDGDTGWPTTRPKNVGKVLVVFTRPSSHPAPKWAISINAY